MADNITPEENTPVAPEQPVIPPVKTSEEILQQRLEDVDNAIRSVLLGGQSYKIGSRALTRADLNQLYAMRKQIAGEIASAKDSILMDDTYVAFFNTR